MPTGTRDLDAIFDVLVEEHRATTPYRGDIRFEIRPLLGLDGYEIRGLLDFRVVGGELHYALEMISEHLLSAAAPNNTASLLRQALLRVHRTVVDGAIEQGAFRRTSEPTMSMTDYFRQAVPDRPVYFDSTNLPGWAKIIPKVDLFDPPKVEPPYVPVSMYELVKRDWLRS